jgi:hypothetical protein
LRDRSLRHRRRAFKRIVAASLASFVATLAYVGGCGSTSDEFATTRVPDGGGASTVDPGANIDFQDDAAPKTPCEGLRCSQVKCDQAGTYTSVSGTVTAPNGTLPLYNAIVYVPNAPLDPVPEGASCDHCGNVSGDPIVATITDYSGHFVLNNVPAGQGIPLVVQMGKWRRELTVDVAKCVDNPIVDGNATRLPRNSSEGHIPKIAVTTGWCDQLACLLPKLGLDASEYSLDHQSGRLHLYRGSPAKPNGATVDAPAPAPQNTPDAQPFWSDLQQLESYDMLMLSCECGEHNETKSPQAMQALYDYASAGGRVFASHFHYTWFQNGPQDLRAVADWFGAAQNPENPPGPFLVDQTFPKGKALAEWLTIVGASSTLGEIPISQPRENVGAVLSKSAQRWVYGKKGVTTPFGYFPDPIRPEPTKYLTVNAPVTKPAADQCGKATFADMHLYAGDEQNAPGLPDDAFPSSCGTTLTPEEKALAFLFFDLSSCVQNEQDAPEPPVK